MSYTKPSGGDADAASGKREPDEISDVKVQNLEVFQEGGGQKKKNSIKKLQKQN